MKKIIQLVYLFIIGLILFSPKISNAQEMIFSQEHKLYSDKSVIVFMNDKNDKTRQKYSLSDFNDVRPDYVEYNDMYKYDVNKLNVRSDCQYECYTLRWNKSFSNDELNVLIKQLQAREDVYFVQPNYLYEIQSNEYENLSSQLMNSTSRQSDYDICNVTKAWDLTIGSRAVKVGIIDSGIDGTHPDLIDNLNNNLHKDFTSSNEQPLVDNYGHGTAAAGVVGANGDGGQAVYGICREVSLVSLKVYDPSSPYYVGYIESSKVKLAIDYANANNIQILNFSGHLINSSDSNINDLAVFSSIQNYDGLFVCSASNSVGKIGIGGYKDIYANNDIYPIYPANYSTELSNVISVGGLDSSGQRTTKSRYGENTVSLFANYEMYTTSILNESGYGTFDGTSCSAPMVAGTLALIYSMNINFAPYTVKNILLSNCTPFDVVYQNASNQDTSYEGKKLNVTASIINTLSYEPIHYIQNTSYNNFAETCSLSYNNANYSNKKFYRLNVIDEATYQFRIDNSMNPKITLYDENFNTIEIYNCNNIDQTRVFKHLTVGLYYVKVETIRNGIDNITLEIERQLNCYLSYDDTNSFISDSIDEFNIRYTNNQSSGYYKIIFVPYTAYGYQLSDYPDNMLEIYQDDERSILLNYITFGETSLDMYMEHGITYYFDIETNISDLYSFEIIIIESELNN